MPAFVSGYSAAVPAWFRDTPARKTLITTGPDNFYFTDVFARVVVQLPPGASTSFTVEAVFLASVSATLDPQNNIGVRTSADPAGLTGLVYNQTIASPPSPPTNTKQQVTITIPAGTQYLELTGNASITGLSAASYYVVPAPAVLRQAVVWGDSISVGNSASPVFLGMYEDIVRHGTRFDSLDVFGISGDTVFNWFTFMGGPTGTATALAARMVGSVENLLIIEMGTNDYGLDFWSAASYQTALAAILDQFHTTSPATKVALIQPGHRGTESAQPTHGSTLADFYAADAAIAAARSYITLIAPLWSQAEINANSSDGLHPNAALHAIAGARLAALYPPIPPAPIVFPPHRLIPLPGGTLLDVGNDPTVVSFDDPITLHTPLALSRLIERWKNKPNLAAILASYTDQLQLLENTLWEIIILRLTDYAAGAQQDVIGRIVGEERQGQNDAQYRARLKVRIRINQSFGTPEDVIEVLQMLDPALFLYQELGHAFFQIVYLSRPVSAAVASQIAGIVRQTRAAGIGATVTIPADNTRGARFGTTRNTAINQHIGFGTTRNLTTGGVFAHIVKA